MLIKLTEPLGYYGNSLSQSGKFWTWWILVQDGRVYVSNRKRAKLEDIGQVA